MNGLAVCAGVGGIELGLRLALGAAYRTVGYIEREAYVVGVLAARMEDGTLDAAPVWDDLESFDGRRWRGRVDLVSGGIPCQPFSCAGKRRGVADDRWLWPAFWRCVREVGAQWLFLENVPGIVHNALPLILGDLAEGGWSAEWDVFSAAGVGANHLRKRLFLLATNAEQRINGVLPPVLADAARGGAVRRNGSQTDVAADARRGRGPQAVQCWAAEPGMGRVADGVAFRVDRLRACGNGVVPLVAAVAWRVLSERLFA